MFDYRENDPFIFIAAVYCQRDHNQRNNVKIGVRHKILFQLSLFYRTHKIKSRKTILNLLEARCILVKRNG